MKPSSSWRSPLPWRIPAAWAYLLPAALLILLAGHSVLGTREAVDASYHSFPSRTPDPDSMLNHANTLFWWGRYRKNTLPEFDTAAAWAQRAMVLARRRAGLDHDTAALQRRLHQGRQLLAQASEQRELCRYNIGSYLPYYMEMMGHEEGYMQEDADEQDVPFIALRGAIGRLESISSPDRVLPIPQRTSFTLVHVRTSNPLAEEMLVQELNNRTRLYTISRHELATILSTDSISIPSLLADTAAMARVAAHYKTDELAVVDFTENDRVDGIYYYGMRFRLWNKKGGWDPRNIYTEYMVRDRVFNQVTPFILPLAMAFLMLALALGMFANVAGAIIPGRPRISLLHAPVCFVVSMVVQYALVQFVLKNFINPAPEEYFTGDAGEQWVVAYPLTFLLPIPVCYLVLGKLDNFIRTFRSDFENPLSLFSLSAGSLLTIPFALTYHQVLRFGFDERIGAIPIVVGGLTIVSALLAHHGSGIVNFPEKMHPAVRVTTWAAFLTYFCMPFLLASRMLMGYDRAVVSDWAMACLPIAAGMEILNRVTVLLIHRKTSLPTPPSDLSLSPKGMEAYWMDERGRLFHEGRDGAGEPLPVTQARSLYVSASRGMPIRSFLERHFKLNDARPTYSVDFSAPPPEGKTVHYPAFAQAFAGELAFTRFNDVAETARQTSNILGKALSAITSIGGLLIDDRDVKARDPKELAATLLDILTREPTILLLDHVERISDEEMLLLQALVDCMSKGGTANTDDGQRPLPVLIILGYGEYGYHDKLVSILERLEKESVKGYVEYKTTYADPVSAMLRDQRMPIQVQLHLDTLLHKEKRDNAPMSIQKTMDALRHRSILFHDPEWNLQLMSLDRCAKLPDIRMGEPLPPGVASEEGLRDLLIAAAYLADSQGRFHLPVLAHALGRQRMESIRLLKVAERLNLVYDLKGESHFYWYSFTDVSYVSDFKEMDNPRQEHVSQLANEYYRGFVEHHLPVDQATVLYARILEAYGEGHVTLETLTQLAERSYKVWPAFPLAAFHINHAVAEILSHDGIARFKEALEMAGHAIGMHPSLHVKDREVTAWELFELKKLRFRMMVETGQVKDESMEGLLSGIRNDLCFSRQEEKDMIEFDFWELRFRFTRFHTGDKEKGDALCQALFQRELTRAQRLRARFFELKLFPKNNFLTHGGKFAEMRVLLGEVEAAQGTSLECKGLYREVLNDYAGMLADHLLPHILQMEKESKIPDLAINDFLISIGVSDGRQLMGEIETMLHRRVEIEACLMDGTYDGDSFSDQLLERLLNDPQEKVDKRGLCYTLNYLSRAYLSCKRFDDALRIGKFAYRFNIHAEDKPGACLSASTLGYCLEHLNRHREANEWYEKSFGHGWDIKHYSISVMAIRLCRTAAHAEGNGTLRDKARFYARQASLMAVLPHFPIPHDGMRHMAHTLLMSQEALQQEGIKNQKQGQPLSNAWGDDPSGFLDRLYGWMKDKGLRAGEQGVSAFGGNGQQEFVFMYRSMPWDVRFPELIGMQLTLTPTDGEDMVALFLARSNENEEWQLTSMVKKKIPMPVQKEDISISPSSRLHMLRHFMEVDPAILQFLHREGFSPESIAEESGAPGSRFFPMFATSIEQLLDRALSYPSWRQLGITGNLEWVAEAPKSDFPEGVGHLSVLPMAGLSAEDREKVYAKQNRGLSLWHLPMASLPGTGTFSIILKPLEKGYLFITAFPGPPSMPLPRETMDMAVQQACRSYWEQHAFLVPEKS